MTHHIRVNVTRKVDNKGIREDTINGRKVLIVPSATMPADIIMNEVKYPAEVTKAALASLDRAPAPCGHPKLAGQFLSARDPEAINHFHIGAWNANVKWEGNRVLLDKVIDVEVAEKSEQGRRVLNAIAKGEPISTSTGLLAEVAMENGEGYSQVAKSIIFDHDAILLDEEPAGSPEQGVGMLVNGKQVPVVNFNLDEAAARQLDWAGQEMMRSVQRAADATLWAKVRDKVLAVIKESLGMAEATTPETNATEDTMSAEELAKLKEGQAALETKVNEVLEKVNSSNLDGIAKMLENLTGAVNGLMEGQKAEAEAKAKAEAEEDKKAVVNAKLMTEDEAGKADAAVLKVLANKARTLEPAPVAAPILRGNLQVHQKDAPKVEDHFV